MQGHLNIEWCLSSDAASMIMYTFQASSSHDLKSWEDCKYGRYSSPLRSFIQSVTLDSNLWGSDANGDVRGPLRISMHDRHGKNVNTDAWRLNQLWRSVANPEHPYSYFHTGNLETLITEPTARGISIHQAVRDFAAQKCVSTSSVSRTP